MEVPGGDILPLPPGKGGVIDGEGHFHGGGGDLHTGQGFHRPGGTDGVPDGDVPDAGHGDDVPRLGLGHGGTGEALELVEAHGLGLAAHLLVVVVAHGNFLQERKARRRHCPVRRPDAAESGGRA